MNAPDTPRSSKGLRRWFGPSAFIALAVLVGGRLLLEPLRDKAHFDEQGMDPFHAVEKFVLRQDPHPIDLAFFGSSQSVWGILSGNVANELELNPRAVRNLASPGGTPLEAWHMVQRNQDRLSHLRCAVIEINPFVLRDALDDDPRTMSTVSQMGSLHERMMLDEPADRALQVGEWLLPVNSVRRSLATTFLDVLKPKPGNAIFPKPDFRTRPFAVWRVRPGTEDCAIQRLTVSAKTAAKRLILHWSPSKLQDESLRNLLTWFKKRHIPVVMHQPPVHPDVVKAMLEDEEFASSYRDYKHYLASLRPKPLELISAFDPANCGLTELHLSDRTHLNEMGARAYSRFLAEKLSTLQEHIRLASAAKSKGVAER